MARRVINLPSLFQGDAGIGVRTYSRLSIGLFVRGTHLVNFHPLTRARYEESPRCRSRGKRVRSDDGGAARRRDARQTRCRRRLTPRDLRDVNEITRELVSDITDKLCPLPRPANV